MTNEYCITVCNQTGYNYSGMTNGYEFQNMYHLYKRRRFLVTLIRLLETSAIVAKTTARSELRRISCAIKLAPEMLFSVAVACPTYTSSFTTVRVAHTSKREYLNL